MASARDSKGGHELVLQAEGLIWVARFVCFASPCEVQLARTPRRVALGLAQEAQREALRIQARYSRFDPASWLSGLHRASGQWVDTDAETEGLLELAHHAWQLSGGRFDISSGVLRKLWHFKPDAVPPDPLQLGSALALVDWSRVERRPGALRLVPGMELDLGGLGKEYAVDRVAAQLVQAAPGPWLVNFGGDLHAGGLSPGDPAWRVGLDDPVRSGEGVAASLELRQGGLATSGDARQFILHKGQRLGHILDARTGWPPPGAPRSVTVQADTCTLAGLLATLAFLQGQQAEAWLRAQALPFHVLR